MGILIKAHKANAYFAAIAKLGTKFNGKYVDGRLEDIVKFNFVGDRIELMFIKDVPEMVRIACNMAFVDTML